MTKLSLKALSAATIACACWSRDPAPQTPQQGPVGGYAPPDFDFEQACEGGWEYGTTDVDARKHVSFPETVPVGCFSRVAYSAGTERVIGVEAPLPGCGYPDAGASAALLARAAVYQQLADGPPLARGAKVPMELACELPDEVRRAAARANARTLRSYAGAASAELEHYPYAVAGTFGFGSPDQNESVLLHWLPGEPCVELSPRQLEILDVNVVRAQRISEAYKGGVAPLVSGSGGAVHGDLIEAFMLGFLAHCQGGVPEDRILYDPCADHTHTNFRNTSALMTGMGARFAYLVTDDSLQSMYMQEWTFFDLMGGSIDQRSLRDFGYLVGAWRQASVQMEAGFWYTPYRFWAEPRSGRGSFTCTGDIPFAP